MCLVKLLMLFLMSCSHKILRFKAANVIFPQTSSYLQLIVTQQPVEKFLRVKKSNFLMISLASL